MVFVKDFALLLYNNYLVFASRLDCVFEGGWYDFLYFLKKIIMALENRCADAEGGSEFDRKTAEAKALLGEVRQRGTEVDAEIDQMHRKLRQLERNHWGALGRRVERR